ncbi:magnesium/cobalt transporter CorA [Aquisalimonas lutea]|uniref:magnesium/cobalt transporter CorA n=1 Tax=Aquisalimonas lutea TaxID=1327750 RepID=UPI0025B2D1B7|nr:magnesium/cobalt transporter CorA [Aquisalimonas lutea]MDN3517150.1 magnesium/cobalt transporter CorA [Aquisalimonas lutea]
MSEQTAAHHHHRRPYELRHRHRRGTAPGTLISRAEAHAPHMTLMSYDGHNLADRREASLEDIDAAVEQWPMNWIDVSGLADADLIAALGKRFGIHPLALEDVINVHQRPKVEDYDANLFVITRMPSYGAHHLELEQLSLFMGEGFVITFQERPGDCFEPVRERIRKSPGNRGRLLRSDYLSYALLDAVVDSYFPILEAFSNRLDELEDRAIARPSEKLVGEMHAVKRQLQAMRRAVWPQRELFRVMTRDVQAVSGDTRLFLRDCEDHAVQILDVVETYRERATSALDLYVTAINHRMNEVMKVLTIIATVFMPLTVITGIYGMNFDTAASPYNMPELGWRYGYPFVLGVITAVGVGLLVLFRRRGWLGGRWRS